MGSKTFVNVEQLRAGDVNQYLMNQGVIRATSTTRPNPDGLGMAVFETDTYATKFYLTSTFGYEKPWNMAWGIMGFSESNANQALAANGDGWTAVTGGSVTFTSLSGRRYAIHAKLSPFSGTSTGPTGATVRLSVDGTPEMYIGQDNTQSTGKAYGISNSFFRLWNTPGTTTVSLSIAFKQNTDNAINTNTTFKTQLWIADVGSFPGTAPP